LSFGLDKSIRLQPFQAETLEFHSMVLTSKDFADNGKVMKLDNAQLRAIASIRMMTKVVLYIMH